ncbi:hypothetical protein Nepgr_003234 [Nepenthes gracilis]|uniref:DNA polymerase eta n=1 Tax=Nepenthes gracilis TaxID=150966 RepID=A0AAD3XDI2_NEPGR|nr:hypothetical protein Nepgr_003234 [Nepenthes gracilis]
MPVAKPESSDARVIAHIDMDCFYVQVEQRKQPELRGLPTAVVQYNSWKGGGLIAVSYEARKFGVKRSMRGDEAKYVCPEIQLVQVPVAHGKADLKIYRNAGSEVVSILARKGRCERASIDEVYLDLTDAAETMLAENPPESLEDINDEALKSHIVGLAEDGSDVKEKVKNWLCRTDASHRDKLLACGALIVAELRAQVFMETEFTCSAGIAHNKILAKLTSGMNKPAQQTVVPSVSVKELLAPLPIKKMKQLGGKLGDSLKSNLGVSTIGDLLQFSTEKLQECYGINTGTWLWNIARGISGEKVEGRILPKSHGSGKSFPGPHALRTIGLVEHWLNELCQELSERLVADFEQNKRIAHTLTLNARAYMLRDTNSQKKFPSKSSPLRYGIAKIQEDALNLFHAGIHDYMGSYASKGEKNQNNGWGITALSVSASKIFTIPRGTGTIMNFFPTQSLACCASPQLSGDASMHEVVQLTAAEIESGSKEFTTAKESIGGIPGMYPRDQKRKIQEDKGIGSIMGFFEVPVQSCPSLNQEPHEETSRSSGHGSESCWQKNQAESQNRLLYGEQPQCLSVGPTMNPQEGKRKKLQGTSSILRFLKSSKYSTHDRIEIFQEPCVPSSSGEMRARGSGGSERGEWSYKANEIDPTVIDELPPHIQQEVWSWLKQSHSSKPSSSTITRYFFPPK